jgi:hypothetical protein
VSQQTQRVERKGSNFNEMGTALKNHGLSHSFGPLRTRSCFPFAYWCRCCSIQGLTLFKNSNALRKGYTWLKHHSTAIPWPFSKSSCCHSSLSQECTSIVSMHPCVFSHHPVNHQAGVGTQGVQIYNGVQLLYPQTTVNAGRAPPSLSTD